MSTTARFLHALAAPPAPEHPLERKKGAILVAEVVAESELSDWDKIICKQIQLLIRKSLPCK